MGPKRTGPDEAKERTDNMNKKAEAIILGIVCFILTIAIFIQINTVNNNG